MSQTFAVSTEAGNLICKASAKGDYVSPKDKRAVKMARLFKSSAAAARFAETVFINVSVVPFPADLGGDRRG